MNSVSFTVLARLCIYGVVFMGSAIMLTIDQETAMGSRGLGLMEATAHSRSTSE